MAKKHLFYNNYTSTLVGAISAAAVSATVADAGPLITPDVDEVQYLTLFDDDDNLEIISVTGVAGAVLTIARNQDGTTAPVGGWPNGTKVGARLTGGMLANLVQGSPAGRFVKTDLPAWAASTFAVAGDVTHRADSYVMICTQNGTTGGTEPTGTGVIVDGDAKWQAVNLNQSFQDLFEAGDLALAAGRQCAAMGDGAKALRYFSLAVGWLAAAGEETVSIGPRSFGAKRSTVAGIFAGALADGSSFGHQSRAGISGISLGAYAGNNTNVGLARGRAGVEYAFLSGANMFAGADYSIGMLGHPIVAAWQGTYTASPDARETAEQSTYEAVIYSVPVNLGDGPAWAASTVYDHGEVVFPTVPNGKCYVAKALSSSSDDYFTSKTSDTVEPSWPTSAGSTVTDVTGLVWECVDPTSIIMKMGDYSRFVPTELGFICDEGASPTGQPTISFGINGNLTKWLAGTATTKLSGALAGEFFTPTNTEGDKNPAAGLVTAGTGNITGRFYMKGMVIETMTL